MSGPGYHGRTHLPGGTDPIPGLEPVVLVSTPIDLRNPSAKAYFAPLAKPDFTLGIWGMTKDVDSTITGVVLAPDDFTALRVRLVISSPSATNGDVRMQVATTSLSEGDDTSSEASFSNETARTISVTDELTYADFPTSGTLASTPAGGDMVIVRVIHDGDHSEDTLNADLVLWGAWLIAT